MYAIAEFLGGKDVFAVLKIGFDLTIKVCHPPWSADWQIFYYSAAPDWPEQFLMHVNPCEQQKARQGRTESMCLSDGGGFDQVSSADLTDLGASWALVLYQQVVFQDTEALRCEQT